MFKFLLPLLLELGWKEVIFVTDDVQGLSSLEISQLEENGVQHVLICGNQAVSGQWISHAMRTGEDSWRPLNIVMLCSLPCVQRVLQQASILDAEYGSQTAFVMSSRWLVLQTEVHSLRDRLHLENITMDNVLLVQNIDKFSASLSSRIENGTKIWYGLLADLLDVLSHTLNFTYDIVEPSEDVWGSGTAADADTGFFGHVIRKEADIGLTPTDLLPERLEVMDFTSPVSYTSIVMVYRKPESRGQLMTAVVPLRGELLILISGCLLMVTVCLVIVEMVTVHYSSDTYERPTWVWLSMLFDVSQATGAALLSRSIGTNLCSRPGRVLLSGWWVFSLLMGAVYSGTLTAFLSVNKQEQLFTSLEDLVSKEHDYKWGTFGRSGPALSLQNTKNDLYRKVWRGIEQFAKEDPDVLGEDIETLANKVRSDNYVLIFVELLVRVMFRDDCSIEIIDVGMRHAIAGLVFPKGSAFTKPVSQVIDRVQDAGLLSQWTATWFPRATCPSSQGPKVISLMHVQGVLLVLPVGVGLALTILAVEVVYVRKSHLLLKQ